VDGLGESNGASVLAEVTVSEVWVCWGVIICKIVVGVIKGGCDKIRLL
jgi:hypothetical protein